MRKIKQFLCRLLVSAGVLGLLFLLPSCASLPLAGRLYIDIDRSPAKVIVSTDGPEDWGKAAHPFLMKIGEKSMALTYNAIGDVSKGARGRVALDWPAYSKDSGKSWLMGDWATWVDGAPEPFYRELKKDTVSTTSDLGFFFGQAVLSDGRRISMLRRVGVENSQPENLGTGYAVLTRDGESYSGPVPIRFSMPPECRRIGISPRGIINPAGNHMVVGYGKSGNSSKFSTFLFEANADGLNYDLKSIVADESHAPWGLSGPCEPALEIFPNGELLCIMRTGSSSHESKNASSPAMLSARSTDGGLTWERKWLPFPGVMPQLLRMSNGILVCAFGRPGNNLIFSLNDGHTWINETSLTGSDVLTTGYVGLLEISSERLYVVYDKFNSPTGKFWLWNPVNVNAVYGMTIDVRRRF